MNLGRYAVAFTDLDGELFHEIHDSENELRAGQRMLFAHFPESETEIAGFKTFEEMNQWCGQCEVAVSVIAIA